MTIETTPHTPATRQLMEAVGADMQRILVQTMADHGEVPNGESAIMEGTLFALCAVAFDMRPDTMSPAELAKMICEQASKYVLTFEAEASIGPAQGTA